MGDFAVLRPMLPVDYRGRCTEAKKTIIHLRTIEMIIIVPLVTAHYKLSRSFQPQFAVDLSEKKSAKIPLIVFNAFCQIKTTSSTTTTTMITTTTESITEDYSVLFGNVRSVFSSKSRLRRSLARY